MSKNFIDNDNVYILGDFDETISENVIPGLYNMINKLTSTKNPNIEVFINSRGGYTSELHSLYYMLCIAKSRGIKITTNNMGMAFSAGSMLAVIGDHRRMFKYATNLMHFGQTGSRVETPKQQTRENKRVKEYFSYVVDVYKNHTKMDIKKIEEFMNDDLCYLNAKDCLKFGLCDEIVSCI
jgi:ATP-dependent protease ClpP protease subunit